MIWKDVALKLLDVFDSDVCVGEIFDEMGYLFNDGVKCCDCKECLIRHMEREGKVNENC